MTLIVYAYEIKHCHFVFFLHNDINGTRFKPAFLMNQKYFIYQQQF